ncbi:MAG TPA: proteasome accessory factor PafA2 [Candidatus Yaniella excrementigallinarum]|nr:proteasome accessory factor PafA2 [Candidatus Yaniella excrementigallinarum]
MDKDTSMTSVSLVPASLAAKFPANRPTAGYGVHRVVGLETEFGIHAPSHEDASHSVMSLELINSYGHKLSLDGTNVASTEWDYNEESPLLDARGWQMPRSIAHPSQLTDQALVNDDGQELHMLVNLILPNGARFYVDHAHPEFSSPETTNPLDAVIWDQAGDRIAQQAADHVASAQDGARLLLYKNNTDSKSVSYGAHENYLVARQLDFDELTEFILGFFTTRQIITGAGRVGIGSRNERAGFQISQRADFFEEEVGLETTIRRPIVNARDEPHARPDAYRRLHVIIGDANLSQYSTWLRVGMTSLVLSMIELGELPMVELAEPVQALQDISHDPSLQTQVLVNGRGWMTAIDIQRIYQQAAQAYIDRYHIDDQQTVDVVNAWAQVLDLLEHNPAKLADRLDWIAKYQLLNGMRERHGLDWSNAKLGMLDLQWADLRQDKGLYHTLVARGAMRTIVNNEQIQHAINFPPTTTRAWARGRLIERFGAHLAGVSWETVLVRPFRTGPIHRFHFPEPLSATADALHGLLDPELPQISLDDTSANHAELTQLLKQLQPYRAIGHR